MQVVYVKRLNIFPYYFTLGKIYEVDKYDHIRADNKWTLIFSTIKECFITVQEYREKKLKRILK